MAATMPLRPASLDAASPQARETDASDERAQRSPDEVMLLRGVRGATTVDANNKEAILQATTELLTAILESNSISATMSPAFSSRRRRTSTQSFPHLQRGIWAGRKSPSCARTK